MTIRLPALAAVMMLASGHGHAGAAYQERFELWNNCQPVRMTVEEYEAMPTERIEIAVRSRLRAARLYTSTKNPTAYLYVTAHGVGKHYVGLHLRLEFRKWTRDDFGESGVSSTWIRHSTAISPKNDAADYAVQIISELTDKFIDDYLRINEESCAK